MTVFEPDNNNKKDDTKYNNNILRTYFIESEIVNAFVQKCLKFIKEKTHEFIKSWKRIITGKNA